MNSISQENQLTPVSNLNKMQEDAIGHIINWYVGQPNSKYITLSGAGGSGKTYLLHNLCYELIKRARFLKGMASKRSRLYISITATQNDAVGCLVDKGFQDAVTIYSLLGLRVQPNYRTGLMVLKPSQQHQTHRINPGVENLIIIDEASHVSLELYKQLERTNARFLFIGDAAQLLSPSDKSGFSVFNKFETFELNGNERANDGDLSRLNRHLRDCVLNQKSPDIIPNDHSIQLLSDRDFLDVMQQKYLEYRDPDVCKVLTYTNSCFQRYNGHIRNILRKPSQPIIGDTIISNSIYRGGGGGQTPTLFKSAARINIIKEFKPYGDFNGMGSITAQIPTNSLAHVNLNMAHSPHYREERLEFLKREAKQIRNWKDYYYFLETTLNWRFPYAETTHKSQGRTYSFVFVDLPDIFDCTNIDTVRRLLYVAVSRARFAVFIRKLKSPVTRS